MGTGAATDTSPDTSPDDECELDNCTVMYGRVSADIVSRYFPAADADTIALVCGPLQMQTYVCVPALRTHGLRKERIFVF